MKIEIKYFRGPRGYHVQKSSWSKDAWVEVSQWVEVSRIKFESFKDVCRSLNIKTLEVAPLEDGPTSTVPPAR